MYFFPKYSFNSSNQSLNLRPQNASSYEFSFPETVSSPQSLNLEIPQNIDLQVNGNLSSDKFVNFKTNFSSESEKVSKILSIQNQLKKATEEQFNKISSKKEAFAAASRAIKSYQANRRKRKEEAFPDNLTLTRENKEALKSFYESFYTLETKQKELLSEFSKVAQVSLPAPKKLAPATKEKPNWEKLKKALEDMNWESNELTLFGGELGKNRTDDLGDIWWWDKDKIECIQDRECGWNSWDKNPYNSFHISREKWKQSIKKITDPQKKLHDMTIQPRWVICGIVSLSFGSLGQSWCGDETKEKLKREIQAAKNEFNYEIWSKFLEWMEQS